MKPEPDSIVLSPTDGQAANLKNIVSPVNLSLILRALRNFALALTVIAFLLPLMLLCLMAIAISGIIKAGPDPLNITKY